MNNFINDDKILQEKVQKAKGERKKLGLEDIVGELQFAVINVEEQNLEGTVREMNRYTGYSYSYVFEDEEYSSVVMSEKSSADIIIRARKTDKNPFSKFNDFPKSRSLANTRLETLAFSTVDIQKYYEVQRQRGVKFLTGAIQDKGDYLYLETMPSAYTGISTGIVQWKGEGRSHEIPGSKDFKMGFIGEKPEYAKNIGFLDHVAIRVGAQERDDAIIEFMNLTNYDFKFSIYVKSLNSITNVTRISDGAFAGVFTSGIGPYVSDEESGPTEKFIHNYGTRVHHMAFLTEDIENTFESLKYDGMEFLSELVGSEAQGLRQAFSQPSKHTLMVNEYIKRYGDFDGFFTKDNVTELTRATEKQ